MGSNITTYQLTSDGGDGLLRAVKPRERGLAPWSPQKRTWALIEQVRKVLVEYRDYLPLTLRQIFYRLVGAHAYAKEETAYKRLTDMLGRAREPERLMSWISANF
jgi:hypothetical protein